MKLCISCGICDKKYFCLILGFTISVSFAVPFTKSDNKLVVNENFLYCIFIFFLGYSLCFIPELIYKNCNKSKNNEMNSSTRNTINSSKVIHYIFNKNNSNTKFSFKEMIIFFFICLILLFKYILFYINMKNYYDINSTYFNTSFYSEFINNNHTSTNNNTNIYKNNTINDEFIFFSYIIIIIVSAFVFKNTYYRHQYCSITILVLLGISKLLIRFTFLEINYFYILQSFLVDFITSIIYGYLKGLMKYKFFSIYKCNYLPGLINIVIIIICYFSLGNEINNFINQTKDRHISIEFDTFNIVFSILSLIGSALYGIFMNQILNNYTIFHIFLPFNLFYLIFQINDTNQLKENFVEYVLLVIIGVAEFIIMLVFLELIEINFCSLSYNTKKNIRKRASKESSDLDKQNKNNDNGNDNSLINDEMDEEDSVIIEDENEKIELDSKKK